jgi:hypothetical protein
MVAPVFWFVFKAPKGTYCLSVTSGVTLKAGQKTSPPWRIDLFVFKALINLCRNTPVISSNLMDNQAVLHSGHVKAYLNDKEGSCGIIARRV